MKYIIMCGGQYNAWTTPKQLIKVNGEPILKRTIRFLQWNGVTDIAISSNNPIFQQFGLPILNHNNLWGVNERGRVTKGTWVNGFYPMDEPVCYILGDVVFSPEAIKTIVETETDDVMFFASAPPFDKDYIKPWAEPFAFKVVNTQHFKESIEKVKMLEASRKFRRPPIAWELWQVIKGTPLNKIDYTNYTVINDYTCDIDYPKDAKQIQLKMIYS